MTTGRAAAIAAVGALAAVVAGGRADATGLAVAGVAWFALFGAALGLLGASATPATWLVTGSVLTIAGWGDAPATVAAVGVLVAGHIVARRPAMTSWLGIGVAAAAPFGAVRLVWPTTTGATALVATAVLVSVAISAWPRLDPHVRRAAVLVAGGVGGLTVLAGVAAVANGLGEMRRLDRAVDAVDGGLDAVRAGDTERGGELLQLAAATFDDVGRGLDAPWARPGRAVPVLGRQLDATDALVAAAARLASVGAEVADSVDADQLRPVNGRVDLDALADFERPLLQVRSSLQDVVRELGGIRSPWLVPQLAGAIADFDDRAHDAETEADGALRALEVAPSLLGADGERRWFVAIVTPAQTRGAGGYMGSYGIIRADDGRIDLEHLGRHDELSVPTGPLGPQEYVDRYWANFGLDRFAGNLTASPHFPSVATTLAAKYAALTGVTVDGAIAIDPDAFTALLGLVGAVSVPDWPEPISVANARHVLLHDQYVALGADTEHRVDFLEAVAREVFDRITSGGLPKPADVGAALTPLLPGRHLQLWSARADEQRWFEEIGAGGALAPVRDDALAVVQNNASRSKVDWFLHRDISYDVAPDGHAELVVRFHNDAPSSGLPAYVIGPAMDGAPAAGVNRIFVAVFTPRAPVTVTVDGAAVVYSVTREQGRHVAETFVEVPPGGDAELRVELDGVPPASAYRLDLHGQPMVNPDRVRVSVDGEVLFDGEQTTDLTLRRR